jgi:cyclopropane fatty-acyl-phospholipid synthase-like methyltransferase
MNINNLTNKELILMSILGYLVKSNRPLTKENIEFIISVKTPLLENIWNNVCDNLISKGYIIENTENNAKVIYTHTDKCSDILKYCYVNNVLVKEFYSNYYQIAQNSEAHGIFCSKVYGKNFCQHGMADMNQINKLLKISNIKSNDKVLEIGCGSGYITKYIYDATNCSLTGIDLSEKAIEIAKNKYTLENNKLNFISVDMNKISSIKEEFDFIIAIDSLFFSGKIKHLLLSLGNLLRIKGKLFTFMIYPNEQEKLNFEKHLNELNYKFQKYDFTKENTKHWELKSKVLVNLKNLFLAENNMFLYKNRITECNSLIGQFERYLYEIQKI